MKAAGLVAVVVGGCMLGVFGFAAAQVPVPAGQAQTPAARAPSKTPLGRLPAEVLASKIVVTNMQKSFDFYTKVVGLKPAKALSQAEPIPPAGPDNSKWPGEYALSFTGTLAESFMDLLRPRADNMPTPASAGLVQLVFKVPDAPAVLRRAKEAGYTVTREAPVVGPGEMSIGMLSDPDGYRVEILQAGSYPADAPVASGMTMMGTSIPSADFERSVAFYTKGLGMTATQGAGPNEMVVMFPGGGTTILLQKAREPADPTAVRSSLGRMTFLVPDLKALGERLAAAGYPLGRINVVPQYHVSVAQMKDPDGNSIELVQRGP
jgi:lactoylglutathione lyase